MQMMVVMMTLMTTMNSQKGKLSILRNYYLLMILYQMKIGMMMIEEMVIKMTTTMTMIMILERMR